MMTGLLGTCESTEKPCGARTCGSSDAFHGGTMSFQMVLLLYDEAIAAFAELGD